MQEGEPGLEHVQAHISAKAWPAAWVMEMAPGGLRVRGWIICKLRNPNFNYIFWHDFSSCDMPTEM